ncbi:MAG: elongation factor 4 [Candidatus Dojkabacteria bacterium]|nr:MAG: elongation factor 4 [Candidatus Dojkabacteria bacterium]
MDTSKTRNFCIIAHIDHGKSTLADRLMETSGLISERELQDRMLDTLDLEKERGITIKLQTARLKWKDHILNLIDTPGHVDFSYEVSRSVAACEGALIVVDASQGIQAQTLSTVYKALEYDLKLIPVINKVDLPNAEVDKVKNEMIETFGFREDEFILASGKTGIGAQEILDAIIDRIPAPNKNNSLIYLSTPDEEKHITKALVFDAFYHDYKGVVALVKIVSGTINSTDKLYFLGTKKNVEPLEIGYLMPKMVSSKKILEGEVGYIATGLKNINDIHTGDTVICLHENVLTSNVTPLEGYKAPKPMVFASLYPIEASEYEEFANAIKKLALNDAALTYQKEYSQALGSGFVCGFLGLLHLEITQERLEREYGIDLISTVPTVEFKIKLTTKDYSKVPNINIANIDKETNIATIRTAAEFPDGSLYSEIYEPWVRMEILTPEEYIGPVMELAQENRGIYKSMNFLTKTQKENKHALIIYEIPTVEIIVNFFDKLKSITHGYASMDYNFLEYRVGDIVKVTILVNYEPVEALSFLTHRNSARVRAKNMVEKLSEIIPRQQFKVPIQAAIGGEVIARETIQAYRKDVTAKLYGGDVTRKKKLLEKQKQGKKKMKMIGNVEIPKEAFLAVLKN